MCHRVREAMKDTTKRLWAARATQVQVDETYTGNTSKRAKGYKKRPLATSSKSWHLSNLQPGRTKAFPRCQEPQQTWCATFCSRLLIASPLS